MSFEPEPSFVIELLNYADDKFSEPRRGFYPTPLHIQVWFKHPSIPSLDHTYEVVAGPGANISDWTHRQVIPLDIQRDKE
ncbi:unnamed protein product [Bursaphelenchus okinawaensis]|uniref:Uncharacterized protein n=1 Tax=Bursaphelenchus okinawaensis TaxID=465554 RepID=A0A811LGK4_9BILA|nr:unnamed protein product [Bursaphelenchus okinawaensis]CAG9122014.1 unnamed protein product [Bursaphelenchus okinawaensis]